MTAVAVHKEHLKEHLQELECAISIGIEKRSATIGLHVSAGSISLLEMYLHLLGKITAGTVIKHEWFKRPKLEQKIMPLAERKLEADFPKKREILELMYALEEERNRLIYGHANRQITEMVVKTFYQLLDLIKVELAKIGEEIE